MIFLFPYNKDFGKFKKKVKKGIWLQVKHYKTISTKIIKERYLKDKLLEIT